MTFNPNNSLGPFIQTSLYFPEHFPELRVKLIEYFQSVATNINIRQIGVFDLQEFVNGQQWFTSGNPQLKRFGFRQVYELPATAAGATTVIPHNITGVNTTTTFTHIYGTCVTDVVDNRPIPYASATTVTDQIEINVDATNINVINGASAPGITSGYIILEYLKN